MLKTVDCLAMSLLFVEVTRAEMCLVCLQAMEYDFVGMYWNLVAIAVNAMDLGEWAVFVVCSVAFEVHSKYAVLFHCLLLPEPLNLKKKRKNAYELINISVSF